MRQLSLFPHDEPPLPTAPTLAEPPLEESFDWLAPPDVLPGQLHLFSDRTLRLGRAWAAVAEARLDDAGREFAALKKRYPTDGAIGREALRVAKLHRQLAKALASPIEARAAAILALARDLDPFDEPWAALRRELHRRVAAELRRAQGDAAELDGQPPGAYLIEAGACEEAKASLERTLALRRSVRALFLLADATSLLGDVVAARRLYLEALLVDPFDTALGSARDESVRALPSVVRYELELDDEPEAWSAAAGIVTGVLPSPRGLPAEALAPAEAPSSPERTEAQREALARARAFVQALADAASPQGRDGARVIEVRRTMKLLSPALFAAYMDRVVQAKSGR